MTDRYSAAARVVERMRDESYAMATVVPNDPSQTEIVRRTYRDKLRSLCEKADVSRALDVDDAELWGRIWRKFQYTQLKAKSVNEKYLPSLEQIPALSDPSQLASTEWAIEKTGPGRAASAFNVTGRMARAFLAGDLSDGRYHKAVYRLHRLVTAARMFVALQANARHEDLTLLQLLDRNANGARIATVPMGNDEQSCERAMRIGREMQEKLDTGFVTALHILMDIGMPVIKPDTWMIRMIDAMGFETAGATDEVVRITTRIARQYRAWNTVNPLREVDFVMVKFAQAGGPTEGIVSPIETDAVCPITRRWMQEELSALI
jgi:hypothetical protein